jgi:hypothetical protein
MTKKHLLLVALVLPLMASGFLSQVLAQNATSEPLVGLKAVRVEVKIIEGSDQRVQEIGLAQLLTQTEKQLSNAGLKVLGQDEYLRLRRSSNYPLALLEILIGVFTIEEAGDVVVYAGHVRLNQTVCLARKPSLNLLAPTWEFRTFGPTNDLPSLRERFKDIVSKLVQDYKSAGPAQ